MRKLLIGLLIVGGIGGVGYLFQNQSVRREALEALLTHIVGAPVEIRQVEAIQWKGGLSWRVCLRDVLLRSTLPGDTYPVACLSRVELSGTGRQIHKLILGGGRLFLYRLEKKQKNFRYFPKRGSRSPTLAFQVQAESLAIDLVNLPPGVHLRWRVPTLEARVEVDSAFVRIKGLETQFAISEVCLRDRRWPFPAALWLQFRGEYEKEADTWRQVSLYLRGEKDTLQFAGEIQRWERPDGVVRASLSSSLVRQLSEEVGSWVGGGALSLAGSVTGESYEGRLWGRWRHGDYDFCLQGEGAKLKEVEGRLRWIGVGVWRFRGPLTALAVRGVLWYKGFLPSVEGYINLPARVGRFTVGVRRDTLRVEGSWDSLTGTLAIGGYLLRGHWRRGAGVSIEADSLEKSSLIAAIEPYQSLFGGQSVKIPIQLYCRRFVWDSSATLDSGRVTLTSEGRLLGEGYLQIKVLPAPVFLRLWSNARLASGSLSLTSPYGYLFGEWKGDSATVSLIGYWEGIFGVGTGEIFLSTQRLWLRSLRGIYQSSEALLRGNLSPKGADVQVSADLHLPQVLAYVPLRGMQVSSGRLLVDFCAQGSWDTLLRWDNPSEGKGVLQGVSAYFPALALPMDSLYVSLAYGPEYTRLESLSVRIGEASLSARGEVAGVLSYLYTDWYKLRGWLDVVGEGVVLDRFWRRREADTLRRQLRIPTQMDIAVRASLGDVDIYGIRLDRVYAQARLSEAFLWVDTLGITYAGAQVWGRGALDGLDTACYMASIKIGVQELPIQKLLREVEADTFPTLNRLGLQGRFSGEMQVSLRFSSTVEWAKNSSLWAHGAIQEGRFRTPRFFRWFRPYYLAAYRDSMDFLAEVPAFYLQDGFLRLQEAFLLTRVGVVRVSGYHYLPADRFLYRLQGARLYRRVQRQPRLDLLSLYALDFVDRSVLVLYVEKEGKKVRWHYPLRYLLRRLLLARPAEPISSYHSSEETYR